ncbi:MAG: 50S ribosomal protein L18 [Candidatus Eisenbacteria bacterium]
MKSKAALKYEGRLKRKKRVRRKIFGDPERPRLTVYRSLKHMNAQIVDDASGRTLVYATTTSKEFSAETKDVKGKSGKSAKLGEVLARKAKEAGISKVRFDRSGYAYHGRVKALAEAARKEGLEF